MNPSDIVNVTEMILWSLFGVGFAVAACRVGAVSRLRLAFLAVAFLAFGLSDYIELQTGAWWRPLWLLFLKAACIAVFLLALRRYWMERAIARKPPVVAEDGPTK